MKREELFELIDEALAQARDEARQGVGRALIAAADNLLGDPQSDAVDRHVSGVLRELGDKLSKMTSEELITEGLMAMVEEIRNEQASA